MIALPEALVRALDVTEYCILERFHSKRNEVWKVGIRTGGGVERLLVVKRSGDRARGEREAGLLSALGDRGAPVPDLIYHRGAVVVTEYIEGPHLVGVLLRQGGLPVDMLGDALDRVYRALRQVGAGLVLGDMNLRNFILEGERNRVCRVDLESAAVGCIAQDLGKLCAFCLTYDPPFGEGRMQITRALLEQLAGRLRVSADRAREELLLELATMERRRRMSVPDAVKGAVAAW